MKKKRKKNLIDSTSQLTTIIRALALTVSCCGSLSASVGVVGGGDADSDLFATVITSTSGSFTVVSGLPESGAINAVSINESGVSLIAGETGSNDGYVALVSPSGSITSSSTISFSNGELLGASINSEGAGLVGGRSASGTGYAAQVSSDGTITALNVSTSDRIRSTALLDTGAGLIGGEGGSSVPYAAFVQSDGTVDVISGLPTEGVGDIRSVDYNSAGRGIVGGWVASGGTLPYAAIVTSSTTTDVTGLPDDSVVIYDVALNESNLGIIGGGDGGSDGFAVHVAEDGSATSLLSSFSAGTIYAAAINDSGSGIIGGELSDNLYAAQVSSAGDVSPVFSADTAGLIRSVAINAAGVGLIGGQAGSDAYVALVAPNGTLTSLNVVGDDINSVALVGGSAGGVLAQVTPSFVGPATNVINSQLAFLSAFQSRKLQFNSIWSNRKFKSNNSSSNLSLAETAVVQNDEIAFGDRKARFSSRESQKTNSTSKSKNTVWFEPFANYLEQGRQGSIPSYWNLTGGGLLGYDHQEDSYLLGTAVGYGYNRSVFSDDYGNGKIHQGALTFYGAYFHKYFWCFGSVWGGRYYSTNVRRTLSQISSTGKTKGWVFSPYAEFASPWALYDSDLYFIEPFAAISWVSNWQDAYTETGSSGLNLVMPNVHNSLLQSEVGLRFYENFLMTWGTFLLEEKLSYVNLKPLNEKAATTSFVGASSTFPVAVANSNVQNLAVLGISGTFTPNNEDYPYGGFLGQATVNGEYQSYFFSLFCGKRF